MYSTVYILIFNSALTIGTPNQPKARLSDCFSSVSSGSGCSSHEDCLVQYPSKIIKPHSVTKHSLTNHKTVLYKTFIYKHSSTKHSWTKHSPTKHSSTKHSSTKHSFTASKKKVPTYNRNKIGQL